MMLRYDCKRCERRLTPDEFARSLNAGIVAPLCDDCRWACVSSLHRLLSDSFEIIAQRLEEKLDQIASAAIWSLRSLADSWEAHFCDDSDHPHHSWQ